MPLATGADGLNPLQPSDFHIPLKSLCSSSSHHKRTLDVMPLASWADGLGASSCRIPRGTSCSSHCVWRLLTPRLKGS